MTEHMTAEQLRAEIEAKCSEFMGRAIDAQNAPEWNADESCRDAYVEAVKYLRSIAARLSGMAAAPQWQSMETAPRDRVVLVRSPSRGIFEARWSEWLGHFLAARVLGLGLPDADSWCEVAASPEPPHV